MANVLGTLFQEIADAIRAKTNETGTMKPAEFPEKIEAITAGGSGDAVVWWVTFMNGDTELFKMPVLDGDDCKDPLTNGDIKTPTKESTVSTDYTYSGWTDTDGGAAVSGLFEAITADKTVYAAYTESARKYTVKFYDGETLLQSVQVAYGSKPVVSNPSKSGYSFTGWEPTLTTVTGETEYYAKWNEKLSFSGSSWEEIAKISEAGEAADHFALGDVRNEVLTYDGTSYNIKLRIIGFNHDDLADGSGKAGMTIQCCTGIEATTLSLSDKIKSIDYSLLNTIFGGISEELSPYVKEVTKQRNKITGRYGNETGTTSTAIVTENRTSFFLTPIEAGLGESVPTDYEPDRIGTCYELYSTYEIGYINITNSCFYTEGGTRTWSETDCPSSCVNAWFGYLMCLDTSYGTISDTTEPKYSYFAFCI